MERASAFARIPSFTLADDHTAMVDSEVRDIEEEALADEIDPAIALHGSHVPRVVLLQELGDFGDQNLEYLVRRLRVLPELGRNVGRRLPENLPRIRHQERVTVS
jgi:hypothetical protein